MNGMANNKPVHSLFFILFSIFASNEPMITITEHPSTKQASTKKLSSVYHRRTILFRKSEQNEDKWTDLEHEILRYTEYETFGTQFSTKSQEREKSVRRLPLPTYPKEVKRVASPDSMASVGGDKDSCYDLEILSDIGCDGEGGDIHHTSALVSPPTLHHDQITSCSIKAVGKTHPPFGYPLSSWVEVETMCQWAEVEAFLLDEGLGWGDDEYGTRKNAL